MGRDSHIMFIDKAANYSLGPAPDDLVYAEFTSGGERFQRVMSIKTLRDTVKAANRVLDEYAERHRKKVVAIKR